MATIRLISSLLRDVPPTNATTARRADWFTRKADLFDRISAEDPALAGEAARLAESARVEAERLRREEIA